MVVATSPGVMVGTFATQYQSDKFGRRSTLLTSAVPFCAGTVGVLHVQFCTGKIITILFVLQSLSSHAPDTSSNFLASTSLFPKMLYPSPLESTGIVHIHFSNR